MVKSMVIMQSMLFFQSSAVVWPILLEGGCGYEFFHVFNLASQWPRRRDVAPRCCCLGIRRSQRQRRRHCPINSDVLRSALAAAEPVARSHTWFDYSNEVCVSEAAERHIPWRQRSTRQSDRHKGRKYNSSLAELCCPFELAVGVVSTSEQRSTSGDCSQIFLRALGC